MGGGLEKGVGAGGVRNVYSKQTQWARGTRSATAGRAWEVLAWYVAAVSQKVLCTGDGRKCSCPSGPTFRESFPQGVILRSERGGEGG